jgi:hypothetical protein
VERKKSPGLCIGVAGAPMHSFFPASCLLHVKLPADLVKQLIKDSLEKSKIVSRDVVQISISWKN